MTLRRVLFWIHLTAGCVAGLVILVMSVTGVLLAYKRQVTNWSERSFWAQPVAGEQRLSLDALLATIQESQGQAPTNITIREDSAAPVAFDFGRERTVFVNPHTGQILGEGSRKLRAFFSAVEGVHCWLGVSSENRSSGRALTGACNLSFLILVVTGPILWWPKEWNWNWNNLKKITLFRAGPWGRARDWNWHNVLGFWCMLPLFVIVLTGVIMSYAWANNLLYRMTGNTPPPPGPAAVQNAGRGPGASARKNPDQSAGKPEAGTPQGVDKLFARASLQVPDWTAISLRLPNGPTGPLTFSIDRGNGGRPDLRSQLTLDSASGEIVRWEPFSSYNRGRQLRAWARFSHTGEAGGLPGQTLAAMVSLGASLLVFTGLSLGVRRLLAWRGRAAGFRPDRSFHEPGS
jgi:uncharacterized iron-regulated membrane protein